MASLPSPTQVSGKHNAIYEAYYRQVDPKGIGTIEAMDAAKFLKKSGLSDVVLSRIWDLSDPNGRGYLDKSGLFVALKLVSLAQAGNDINLRNILNDTNAPKVGEMPKIIPQSIQSVPASNTDWSMKPMDKLKYEKLFESLQPVQGLIPGNKVKGVLMDSKLPLETLGKIWDLADQDKDGSLDKHEFIVAMHLVYQALEKRAVPSSLPPELQRSNEICKNSIEDIGFVANFPKEMAPPPVPPLPVSIPPAIPSLSRVPPTIPNMPLIPPAPIIQPVSDWVVTPQEKARYDEIFAKSDLDKDGLVSGLEIKDVFLQSGVAQNCLAHIWALCDTNQSGKLTSDQFALALWLVERKKMGIEPPQILAPNMIPPTLRDSAVESTIPQAEPQPTYSNPELEMIAKEIEEMAKERRILETEVAQKEADIRIKSGEVRSLQSELDTLAATLKQLENQKGEAQKRLDDLKAQQKNLDDVLNSINQEIFLQRQQVNKIREQCQKQEATIKEQESELDSKRSELQKFKDEENSLEKEYDNSMKELEGLTKQLQDTQLQISQVKAMVSQLQETQRQMNDSLAVCKTAIELEDPTLVSDYSLKLEPDFREAENVLKEKEIPKKDPFNEVSDDFGATSNTFGSDPFKSNGFSSDPFSNSNGTHATGFDDNFGGHGAGFDDSFGGGFHEKPTDPFAAVSDPFSDKTVQNAPIDSNKNQFENDPFAILHAPTSASQILSPNTAQKSGPPPRPESPSPALPPKKAKQPPPRPAPPRPMQGPTPTKPLPSNGGFGDSSSSGFADFADFDNKKVADFSEDPFKDYRYEDPFSIKDPFTDEDIEVEDPFTDQISSVPVNSKKLTNSNNNYSIGNHTIGASKQNIEPNDLIKNKINKSFDKTTNNIASIATSMKSFHLADRSKGTSGATKNEKVNENVDDETDFANFDAFSRETTETVTTTASSGTDFFEAFNNNFNKNTNSSNVVFDAFGGDTNTETATSYNKNTISNAFNDNFTENFSKLKDTKNVKSRTGNNEINQNFAKFDAFNEKTDFSSHFDAFNKNNKNNLSNHPVKVKEKFSDDYSQAEKFDSDLEAVLKRSLVDQ